MVLVHKIDDKTMKKWKVKKHSQTRNMSSSKTKKDAYIETMSGVTFYAEKSKNNTGNHLF